MSVDTYPAPEVNDTEQLGDAAHFYKDAYIHQLNVMTSGSLDVIKSNNDVHGKWTNTHYVSYHDMQIVKSVSLDSDYPGTPLNAVFTLVGGEGKDAVINLTADDDDDNSDSWQIKSPASNNKFTVGVWTGSAYTARFTITPAGAATFNNAFVFPTADGTADQVLKTDGAGNVAWGTFASNGAGNVVDDTTPQLGGNLDTQGNEITTTAGNDLKLSVGSSADEVHILKANDDIHTKWTNTHCIMFNHLEISKSSYHADYPGSPHDAVLSLIAGEGKNAEINLTADDDDDNSDSWQLKSPASDNEFKIGVWTGARYTERFAVTPAGAATFNNAFVFPTADGTADQVLKTDGSGTVAWGDAASNGAGNVVDDATPQLGGNLDTQGNEITTTAGNDLKLSVGDSSDDVHILKANNDIHTKWNNTHCVVFNDLGIVKSVAHDAEYPGSPSDAVISLIAGEGKDAEINLLADDADNNSDSWQLKSPASDNEFKIGVWTGARYTERFAVTPAGAATFNNAFKFPTADGAANQVLKTNGSGTVAWGDAASNGAGNVVDDATPQLGGNLDTQGNEITTTAGNDLKLSVGSSADEVHILKANDDIHTKWTNTHCIMFNHLEISKSSYHADYPGSPHDAVLSLIAGEGKNAEINLTADDDDDNSDSWQLKSPASDNEFKIGVWTGARYTERFAVTPAGAATFNNAFKFPTADGTADQVLKTNGAGTVAWGDAASNVVDVAPSAQDEYSGMMVATVTAGSTINKHAPVYLSSDGKWDHADADSISTMAYAFSLEASTLNSTFKIALPPGIIINNTSGWAWTVGDTLFLGTTAGSGGIVGSSSKPSASGDIVQRLGFALTADIAYIFTNFTTVEIV